MSLSLFSRDESPILLLVKQFPDVRGHFAAPWRFHARVDAKVVLGCMAGHLDDLAVLCQIGDVQVKGDATLLRALHVAGAAQFHVLLGHDKAVVGLRHHLQAVAGIAAQVAACHQDAITLVGATPYPAPQLMEL